MITANFNITSYLEDRGIKFTPGGRKNVSHGWVGVRCPFCGDHSNHCGINIKKANFNCWICGEHGGIIKFIQAIENCESSEAWRIAKKFREDQSAPVELGNRKPPTLPPQGLRRNVLPEYLLKTLRPKHKKYLRSRKFNPKELEKKYRLTGSRDDGPYPGRIVAPFFLNQKIVTYILIDITGEANVKYLPCPKEKSIVSHKKTLYNIDNVRSRKVAIVEGPFDVWRIGDGAVATMGIQFTRAQLNQLVEKGTREAYVIYDSDQDGQGQRMGKILANQLSGIIQYVEYVELNSGDPDDLDEKSLEEIRSWIR